MDIMDITTLRILATLASLATFLGIAGWAFARGNSERFDAAARIPLHDD